MQNPLALSLWAGMVLYALITVFGVVVFYGVTPSAQALTDGYGVAAR
jgi:hypothetical protein